MGTIYIETYGCQMNEYDSELVRSLLTGAGHTLTQTPEEASHIFLNTCAVREKAQNRIFARVGNLKKLRTGKLKKIGILGCMAQNIQEELLAHKDIDYVIGPDNYREIDSIIGTVHQEKGSRGKAILSTEETYSGIDPTREESVNAWIAIMRGCNNFCSFCIVPFTRGRERSRTPSDIVTEAKKCVQQGFPQVTLLGQNVNCYLSGDTTFTDLMRELTAVGGLHRIRFTSPHPKDFPRELLSLISQSPNICKQIHLPIQSGSNKVLQAMKRGYTRENYLELVREIKRCIPTVALSTDIIVGFPGETHEHYLETRTLMEEVQFDSAFIFKYSPRKGTLAERKYADDVTPEDKTRRIVELNELQKKHTASALSKFIGTRCDVLIENESTTLSQQQCQGRIDQGVTVVVPQDGSIKKGDMVTVEIRSKTSHVLLSGEPLS